MDYINAFWVGGLICALVHLWILQVRVLLFRCSDLAMFCGKV